MAQGKPWTASHIRDLREFWERGLSTAEIGSMMGRSRNSIVRKAQRLGLPPLDHVAAARIRAKVGPSATQLQRSSTTKFLAKIQARPNAKITLPRLKFMEVPE